MSDMDELSYERGARAAWVIILRNCLSGLGYENRYQVTGWIIEREDAVAALRGLCDSFGDNDWPEDLALSDVITKHLGRYLEKHRERGGRVDNVW